MMTVAAALMCAAGGCSTFNADWEAAGRALAADDDGGAGAAHPVLGRWEGEWRSDVSGHSGALRCIVSPPEEDAVAKAKGAGDGADDEIASDAELYEFRFQAVWGLNFKSEYTVHLRVSPVTQGGAGGAGGAGAVTPRFRVEGESDLGFPIGVYRGEGYIEGDTLKADYEAAGDHGVFEMTRPKPAGE